MRMLHRTWLCGLLLVGTVWYLSTAPSREETEAYLARCTELINQSVAKGQTSWTKAGKVSDIRKGFEAVLLLPASNRVDKGVKERMREVAMKAIEYAAVADTEVDQLLNLAIWTEAFHHKISGETSGPSIQNIIADHKQEMAEDQVKHLAFIQAMRDFSDYLTDRGYIGLEQSAS